MAAWGATEKGWGSVMTVASGIRIPSGNSNGIGANHQYQSITRSAAAENAHLYVSVCTYLRRLPPARSMCQEDRQKTRSDDFAGGTPE